MMQNEGIVSGKKKMQDMFAYWDADQRCRFANDAYIDWFGKKPEELINKMTLKDLLKDLYPLNLPHIKLALQGETQVFYRDITLPDGQVIHSIATYHPNIENEVVKGFFVHVADIENTLQKTKKNTADHLTNNIENELNENNKAQLYIIRQINNDNCMSDVAKYLRSNILNSFPGLLQLAKIHLVSVSKLKRDFKLAFNVTPLVYYRTLQMNFAVQYLKEKKVSKKELASLLNFSNPSNFSTYFKRFINDVKQQQHYEQVVKESHELNKIFIAQSPFAIAMFDKEMNYLAISEQWIKDFRLKEEDIIGKNHYDVFPEITQDLREMNNACLKGEMHKCDAYPFKRIDGSIQWLKWDKRPWYNADRSIGGLLIYTLDVTDNMKDSM